MRLFCVIGLCSLLLMLQACGQKGPLVLPDAVSNHSHTTLQIIVPVFGVVDVLTHISLRAGSTP